MKLEIYEESKKKERVLRLRLVPIDGSVCLCAVDEYGDVSGDGGCILSISEAGQLVIHGGLDPSIGLQMNGLRDGISISYFSRTFLTT